jgi:hypothetical protein
MTVAGMTETDPVVNRASAMVIADQTEFLIDGVAAPAAAVSHAAFAGVMTVMMMVSQSGGRRESKQAHTKAE